MKHVVNDHTIVVIYGWKRDTIGRRRPHWYIEFDDQYLGKYTSARAAIGALTVRKINPEQAKAIIG